MKFLVFPAPAHGHVNPMLPLAQELVSRGDEVVFYVTREFETVVRNTGASVRPLDERLHLPDHMPGVGSGSPPALGQMVPRIAGLMRNGLRAAPALAEQARAERADAIVYDPMALWGRAVAEMTRLPAAIFQTTFAMNHSPTLKRQMRKNMKGLPPPRAVLSLLGLQLTAEVFRWKHGTSRLGINAMISAEEDLNIIPVPRSYQPDAGNFDARFLFVGPSVLPRNDRGDFPLEQLDGKPVLFVSLGTTPMNQRPDFYKACFEAFRDTRWQVVMACGKGLEPAQLQPPSNFLVRQRVPQLDVLQRARVFITHGGMNSTMEGLWHGVPLAVFPQFGDQPLNAQRVTELGLGLTLSPGDALSSKALRDTVERLDTDPGYRSRLAPFQKELQESGGHRRAADALHQFLASRQGKERKAA